MKRTILVFTSLIVSLYILFQLSKYALFYSSIQAEVILGVIAIVFFIIGALINRRKEKRLLQEPWERDESAIRELGISKREYEVLLQLSNGLSNKEIADTLFVTESTIKTHVSNLLLKLDVKRRTQAIKKAKSLNLIPL